jgi:hypothetical protein
VGKESETLITAPSDQLSADKGAVVAASEVAAAIGAVLVVALEAAAA